MSRKRESSQLPEREVSITVGGKVHAGTYSVSRGRHPILTVYGAGGSKRAQLGGTPADSLARLLLSELVRNGD